MMLDIVFEASIAEVLDEYMSDQRLKDALFGQGVIAAYGGPKDHGTASIKLMHYQGDLEGQGPVWGYVKGGMGMICSRSPTPRRRRARCSRPASRSPRSSPARASCSRTGRRSTRRTVVCNADPKVALRLLDGAGRPGRLPRRASRTGRSAARSSSSTPR